MNVSNPSSGPVTVSGFGQPNAANRTWAQWAGYQILTSPAIANGAQGPVLYVGSYIGSITAINALTGKVYSLFESGSNIESSAAVWEGKIYVGSGDQNVYCFDDSPITSFSLFADSSKMGTMWDNETITIIGQLTANPNEITWTGGANGTYVPIASNLHPGLGNATLQVSFTKPDGTSVNVTTTTDNLGFYNVSYNPNIVGTWGWVSYFNGERTIGFTYNSAYTTFNTINVTAAPVEPTPTPVATPTPTAIVTPTPQVTITPEVTPTLVSNNNTMTYVYIAVAVVVIAIIAVAAYAYIRRTKKTA